MAEGRTDAITGDSIQWKRGTSSEIEETRTPEHLKKGVAEKARVTEGSFARKWVEFTGIVRLAGLVSKTSSQSGEIGRLTPMRSIM